MSLGLVHVHVHASCRLPKSFKTADFLCSLVLSVHTGARDGVAWDDADTFSWGGGGGGEDKGAVGKYREMVNIVVGDRKRKFSKLDPCIIYFLSYQFS